MEINEDTPFIALTCPHCGYHNIYREMDSPFYLLMCTYLESKYNWLKSLCHCCLGSICTFMSPDQLMELRKNLAMKEWFDLEVEPEVKAGWHKANPTKAVEAIVFPEDDEEFWKEIGEDP
jgi:hypothetical protein